MTDTSRPTRSVAVVVADLIFGSRIRAAADQAGVRAIFARNAEGLLRAAADADLVVLDLDARWLDAATHIRELKQDAATSETPIVGFVSHVRADVIEAARAAGADRVLARSAFVRVLPDLLR